MNRQTRVFGNLTSQVVRVLNNWFQNLYKVPAKQQIFVKDSESFDNILAIKNVLPVVTPQLLDALLEVLLRVSERLVLNIILGVCGLGNA